MKSLLSFCTVGIIYLWSPQVQADGFRAGAETAVSLVAYGQKLLQEGLKSMLEGLRTDFGLQRRSGSRGGGYRGGSRGGGYRGGYRGGHRRGYGYRGGYRRHSWWGPRYFYGGWWGVPGYYWLGGLVIILVLAAIFGTTRRRRGRRR